MMQRSAVFDLPDVASTHRLGWQLAQQLVRGTVLLLEGDLGSGKTSLVKGLGAGLGITDTIDSPTFTLINEYLDGQLPLYHVDLYRLTPAAADQLYLETYWEGVEVELGIVAIEWPERLSYLPPDPLRLSLSYSATGGRQAKFMIPEGLASALNLTVLTKPIC
ncbi:tRNA (adenosine(37)-N6)-threonylcarbamoyltransferase complex ATPase subunit type 1 TsaE [Romeria aff. gracilis LEGE 07310]|uniref:tRNA threonylcarbamoyladenosine biosynthesis protein TsaE n=1 Tax=Vasconcelosia minhoensis LEGE 07310 TaxID=915328 RepID=A0A8J7DNS0_9CYAN|nr:tRNA (adenosine(37)-N6)-threonylcarbamoyltransferase complex ATPase subunit type 1 TsaE [Romeria gracilis]MBE9078515.1 tRNA (adenosine(37)-N6)-threonylcarbamoyltransferase complex ATPase subunit type 1 TsaE [Romeria aff. gracilis LEGE 07310]